MSETAPSARAAGRDRRHDINARLVAAHRAPRRASTDGDLSGTCTRLREAVPVSYVIVVAFSILSSLHRYALAVAAPAVKSHVPLGASCMKSIYEQTART